MGGEERQFRYSMRMQLELAMTRLTFFSYFKWIENEVGKREPEMVVIMLDEFVFLVIVILVVAADVMMESMAVFSVVVVMAPSTSMARDCEEGEEDGMKVDELLSSFPINFVDSVAVVVVGIVDFSLMVNSSLVHINLNSR